MTTLIENHSEHLEQASFTATGIRESLSKAAEAANSWNGIINMGEPFFDNALRILFPPVTLFFGSHGLPPSLFRNFGLFVGGMFLNPKHIPYMLTRIGWAVAEITIQLRQIEHWIPRIQRPRASTQQARDKVLRTGAQYILGTSSATLHDGVESIKEAYTEEMK